MMVRRHGLLGVTPDSYSMGLCLNSESVEKPEYMDLFSICDDIHNTADCDNSPDMSYATFFKNKCVSYMD